MGGKKAQHARLTDKVNRSPKGEGTFVPHPEPLFDLPEGQVSSTPDLHAAIFDGPTPAQRQMREDMERTERSERQGPTRLNDIFDQMLGKPSPASPTVQEAALVIIGRRKDLVLTFHEWAAVQEMIEEGVREGMRLGQQD